MGDLSAPVAAGAAVLLVTALTCWAAVRERAVRRLRSRLADEQALSAVLAGRVDELVLLLDASRAVNDTLEPEEVLQRILDAATAATGANAGSIQLVPGEAPGHLEVVAAHGSSAAPLGHRQRIGEGLAGAVAASREGRLLTGPQRGSYHVVRSSLVVPLLHRDDLVGVLNVAVDPDGEPFSHAQLRTVGILAENAAVAIVNARAHAAARRAVRPLRPLGLPSAG
jgi:phosphoserine phosphatase RsbU/P